MSENSKAARQTMHIAYWFSERVFHHHRKMGTAGGRELQARFHYGKKDYFLGGHPLWQEFRSTFQLTKRPYVIGGLALLAGYVWCWVTRAKRPVSDELVYFHRGEQIASIKQLRRGCLRLNRQATSLYYRHDLIAYSCRTVYER